MAERRLLSRLPLSLFVISLTATAGCDQLSGPLGGSGDVSEAEASSVVAATWSMIAFTEGADVPDRPDFVEDPLKCWNCANSDYPGWVGDGRVFSPCKVCNPEGKWPKKKRELWKAAKEAASSWPPASPDVLTSVTLEKEQTDDPIN